MFTNIQSLPRDPSFMVLGRRMAGEELRMVGENFRAFYIPIYF